jgi:PAS domain-containing protein
MPSSVKPTVRSRTELAGLYRTFFESASIPFLAVDLDTLCVVVANPSFERMLGYRPGELAGQPYSDLTHPADRAPEAALAGTGDTFRLSLFSHGAEHGLRHIDLLHFNARDFHTPWSSVLVQNCL